MSCGDDGDERPFDPAQFITTEPIRGPSLGEQDRQERERQALERRIDELERRLRDLERP